MYSILTDEHKELINKKIKKAINDLDFTDIVEEYVRNELDTLYSEGEVQNDLQQMVTEVIKQHLVKSGLLKDRENK
jgi:hypothetical protein